MLQTSRHIFSREHSSEHSHAHANIGTAAEPLLPIITNQEEVCGHTHHVVKNVKQQSGNNGSSGLCCTLVSPDEAANAANNASEGTGEASHGYTDLHIPHTGAEIALAAVVGYMAIVGGGVTGARVFHEFGKRSRELDKADGAIAYHPDISQEERDAYRLFLGRQRRDAKFQQVAAGAASGVGSTLVGIGTFAPLAGATGLGILSGVGAAHSAHTFRQYQENESALVRAQCSQDNDKHVREHIFSKRAKHLKGNIAGWGLFGAGVLAATDVARNAASCVVPIGFLIGGITSLVAGAAATVVHNTILNDSRFGADLSNNIKDTLKEPLSADVVRQRNVAAYDRRTVTKAYRHEFF